MPRPGAPKPPWCGKLAMKYPRTFAGSAGRSLPCASTRPTAMFLAQYSFAEFTSNILGQVLSAEQRASRPSVFPVTGVMQDLVGEWPLELREPAGNVLTMGAEWLRKPIVHVDAGGAANPVDNSIYSPLPSFVGIKSEP